MHTNFVHTCMKTDKLKKIHKIYVSVFWPLN